MKPHFSLVALLLFHAVAPQASARGEDDARCIEGYEGTQEAERAQNLRRARELALICSAEVCHDSIEQSCKEWVRALDEKIPSAKIVVKDPTGKVLVSGKVSIDDEMTMSGSGREVALDPGTHSVTVSHPGFAETSASFELALGQKGLSVEVVVRPLSAEKPVEKGSGVAPAGDASGPPLWPAFVLGGVSAAGFATLGIFGASARSADSALDFGPDACAATKTCAPERIDSIETNYTVANVGLVVGSVFLASAVGYTIWSLGSAKSDDSAQLTLVPSGVRLDGTF